MIFRFREREKTIEQHEKIWRALRAQDLEKAEKAIDEQMVYLRKSFSQAQEWRRKRDSAETVA